MTSIPEGKYLKKSQELTSSKISDLISYVSNLEAFNKQQKFKYLIVLDYEATCDEKRKIKPVEIIEWPAIVIDTKSKRIAKNIPTFHYYIRPSINPKLTPFCTELTGITQEMVNNGLSIESVVNNWNKWTINNELTNDNSIIVTCGNWDLNTMWRIQKKHLKDKNLNVLLLNKWINIKDIFKRYTKTKPYGMMGMLKDLNIIHQGRHHSGIDDVKNICKIVLYFLKQGEIFDIVHQR